MNQYEIKALETLRELIQTFKIVSVKGELEDEGLSYHDLVKLKDLLSTVNIPLTVKIGGCGAVYDLMTAINIGANNIVAPMIETPYALMKFISMINEIVTEQERSQKNFFINIETISGCNNIINILSNEQLDKIKGIVIGRVDLARSYNLTRDAINGKEIFDISMTLCKEIKKTKLTCGIGGGISVESINRLNSIPRGYFDFFETRKIAFDFEMIYERNITKGLKLAIEFEYNLLRAKIENYSRLSLEECRRSKILEERLSELYAGE